MNIITVNEAAKRAQISGSMVRRLLRQKKINGCKMKSGYWVVYDDDKLEGKKKPR